MGGFSTAGDDGAAGGGALRPGAVSARVGGCTGGGENCRQIMTAPRPSSSTIAAARARNASGSLADARDGAAGIPGAGGWTAGPASGTGGGGGGVTLTGVRMAGPGGARFSISTRKARAPLSFGERLSASSIARMAESIEPASSAWRPCATAAATRRARSSCRSRSARTCSRASRALAIDGACGSICAAWRRSLLASVNAPAAIRARASRTSVSTSGAGRRADGGAPVAERSGVPVAPALPVLGNGRGTIIVRSSGPVVSSR